MKTIFMLFLAACYAACANTKDMNQEKSVEVAQITASDYFIVSQGGGFTGAYETYLVQRDGKIMQLISQTDSSIFIGQLAPETVDSMFNDLLTLDIKNRALSPAGNMNFALTTFLSGIKNTLTWADGTKPDAQIMRFYEAAMREVRKFKRG